MATPLYPGPEAGEITLAKGNLLPGHPAGCYYMELYYSRDGGLRIVNSQNGGSCAPKPADALVDEYYLPDGRKVTWNWTPNGSIYPLKTTSPYPLAILSAIQPQDPGTGQYTPGVMRITVRGAYAPNNTQLQCAAYPGYNGGAFPAAYNTNTLVYNTYPLTDTGAGDGIAYFDLDHLTATGSYFLAVKDAVNRAAHSWGSLQLGYAAPAPCSLTVDSAESTAPTRIGASDGQVQGQLSGLDTGSIVVTLWQDNKPLGYQATVDAPASGVTTASLLITGVPPGEYEVRAQQGSCAFPRTGVAPVKVVVDPPALNIGDQLTFLPWVQPRLTHAATAADSDGRPILDLGAVLRTQDGSAPANSEKLPALQGKLYGPGDVLGLNERAILTTTPHPNSTGFSPQRLPSIDFKDEDLPWRFSLPATSGQPPLPWCFLLVLKDEDADREFTALPLAGPLTSIRVKAAGPYPDASGEQRQYWAHVQLNASLGDPNAMPPKAPTAAEINDFLTTILPTNPDLAYSRVMSPRRLEANTRYQAFLLPAIEAGRRAGLGLAFDSSHLRTAIPDVASAAPELVFPVYYQWRFTTGTTADFEDLVQELTPVTVPATAPVPTIAVKVGLTTQPLPMPTLLSNADQLPIFEAVPLPVASYLYKQLAHSFTGQHTASDRPVVAPPLYGRAYFVTPSLLDPTQRTSANPDGGVPDSWKHTLNLDPRYRALAAMGVQVVQENQEEYVNRAWEQVRDILLVNERLRAAQYALRTTSGLRNQHLPLNITTTTAAPGGTGNNFIGMAVNRLAAASEIATVIPSAASALAGQPVLADYGLHLTSLSLSRVRVSDDTIARATTPVGQPIPRLTAREVIRRSSTPLAAFSPTFRRLSKPFGKYQIGQASRPLRPTQPEPEASPDEAGTLQLPGTSLRQRDALLRHVASGALTAAAARAERVRAYQFADQLVDNYLAQEPALTLGPNTKQSNGDTYPAAVSARFGAAFSKFHDLGTNLDGSKIILGFRGVQYKAPDLDLDALKTDVVTGTDPAPVFTAKIKTVSSGVPAAVSPGHFLGRDFDADHFYVGDFDEPVAGDFLAIDFNSADFLVSVIGGSDGSEDIIATSLETTTNFTSELADPAAEQASAEETDSAQPSVYAATSAFTTTVTTTVATTAAARQTDAQLPIIPQVKVFPVFKDPMGEQLRLRRPELFLPGLADFPLGGVARLGTNQAFVEAYMVGLNHALGSELSWRGFPVELRGTFFQQFWDVREHLNHTVALNQQPTAAEEASLFDIKPLAEWIGAPLGTNAPVGSATAAPLPTDRPLRLALRSELLRRYPTLVIGLQPPKPGQPGQPDPDLSRLVPPRQRLAVGQDLAVLSFGNLTRQQVLDGRYFLLLLERPGQPQFGLDRDLPLGITDRAADPASWNDFSWPYLENLGFTPGTSLFFDPVGKPFAPNEAKDQTHLTDSARAAYALFQEPILAALPLANWLG